MTAPSGDPLGSDHFPIWLNYDTALVGPRPRRWNWRKADWSAFETRLEAGFSSDNALIPDSVESFTSEIIKAAEASIPKTSGTPRRIPVPWWTDDCRDALRARRRAFRKFDKHSTTDNLIAFRKARAVARRTIQEAKRASWREYVSKLNRFTPVTQVWSQIKRISGQLSSTPLPVLKVGNQDILNSLDVANEIGRALALRFSSTNSNPQFQRHKNRCETRPVNFSTAEHLPYNRPFTMAELQSVIGMLRNVSEGPDEVHNSMISHLPICCLEVLLSIFNKLWETGEFPSAWREAIIIPILKPGKSGEDPLHYRPISLTSSLCKVMERLVNVRLCCFLEHNNIFTEAQCGFRKNRSTVDHLLALDTVVRAAFVKRRHVGAVFFDIEGAYDTTWRQGILLKAHNCGIRGQMGTFLQNYLSDRSFRVRVGSELSDRFLQLNGVPQGGVLSVALFALMINDVGDSLPPSVGRSLFVDDLAVWVSASTAPSLERQLQHAVTGLERWTNMNGFRFSTSKTVCMHFCRRRGHCPDPELWLDREPIPVASETRFLGLVFDRRLTYREHFKILREKCFKAMNILKCVSRTSYGADRKTLLLFYRSFIRSKLDYGCFIYDSACIFSQTHSRHDPQCSAAHSNWRLQDNTRSESSSGGSRASLGNEARDAWNEICLQAETIQVSSSL